jgi:stage II sporulation protein D
VLARDGNGQWGGRVVQLRLVGSNGRVTVSGDTMRSALGLKSTWVTFRVG